MNEKKADKLRYWITYLVRDLPEGSTFKPHALHLTIITWFVTAASSDQVVKAFRDQFSDESAFNVTVDKETIFRSAHKIPVNLVSPTEKLVGLHNKALNLFTSLEARWAVKHPYSSHDYLPHIRRRQGYNLTEGDNIEVSSLSLVSARRRGDDERTLLAKVKFK